MRLLVASWSGGPFVVNVEAAGKRKLVTHNRSLTDGGASAMDAMANVHERGGSRPKGSTRRGSMVFGEELGLDFDDLKVRILFEF